MPNAVQTYWQVRKLRGHRAAPTRDCRAKGNAHTPQARAASRGCCDGWRVARCICVASSPVAPRRHPSEASSQLRYFVCKQRVFRFFPPFSFCFLCGRFLRGLQRSPYWKWGRPGVHGWQISQVSSVVTTCVTTVANRRSLRPSAGSPQAVPAASRIHDRQRGSLDDAQEILIAGDEELGPTGQRRGDHPGVIRIAP